MKGDGKDTVVALDGARGPGSVAHSTKAPGGRMKRFHRWPEAEATIDMKLAVLTTTLGLALVVSAGAAETTLLARAAPAVRVEAFLMKSRRVDSVTAALLGGTPTPLADEVV